MKLSPEGLGFISLWEALSLTVYLDASGYETIGYGHLIVDDDPIELWRDQGCTETEALHLLALDAGYAEQSVVNYVRPVLTVNEFDSLTSWTFNLGGNALYRSTLLKKLNGSDMAAVPGQMRRWNKGRNPATQELEVIQGLVNRREAEAWLWTTGDYGSGP